MCAIIGAFAVGLLFIRYQQFRNIGFILQTREQELGRLLNRLLDAREEPLSLLSEHYARFGAVELPGDKGKDEHVREEMEEALQVFGGHAMWVIRSSGQIAFFLCIDGKDALARDALPQEALRDNLKDGRSLHYYVDLVDRVMEVWCVPTNAAGDSADYHGLLVVGRILTHGFLEELSQITGGDVSLARGRGLGPLPAHSSDTTGRLILRRHLPDWRGNVIAALEIETVSPMIGTIVTLMRWGFLGRFIFTGICLCGMAWVLTRWLLAPLKRISASLDAKAVSLIKPLLNDPTEFGHISRLIAEFFRQQEELINEVVERGRIEQALRESEQEFRAITMSVQDAIIMIDETGLVSFWNPAAERVFGFTEDEILGKTFEERLVPTGSAAWLETMSKYWHPNEIASVTESVFELELLRKGGGSLHVELALSSATIGNRTYALAVVRDVGERKRAERTIAEQRMKMINASRLSSLGVMASGVAHEINNPLAIISVATQQLERLLSAEEEDRRRIPILLDNISRNIKRIEGIIRGLRNLSRDGANDPFQRSPVKTIIMDTLELCRARFVNHNVCLDLPVVPDDLEIECRPVQISQVLLNLLNNAFDAIERSREKWVRMDVSKLDGFVEIAVIDSGPGIPEYLVDKVLEPFFTTKDVGRGMGLGLSVSKAIMDAHGGDLSVDTGNGHTCFRIRLPEKHSHKPSQIGASEDHTISLLSPSQD